MEFTAPIYVQCSKCKDKPGPMGQPGFYYVDNGAYVGVKECECHKQWLKENKILIGAYKNNIWVDAVSQTYNILTSYKGEKSYKEIIKIMNYLNDFPDDPSLRKTCLYFYGIDQTQKTTVAQAIGLNLFRKGFNAFYTTMKDFSSMVCKPYPREEEIQEIQAYMKKVENSDLFIIDNAFDRNAAPVYDSGTQSPYIEAFFRDRIDNKGRGVLFVSRVKPEEIRKNGYSDSLQVFIIHHTTKRKTALKFEDTMVNVHIHEIFKDKI
jgi:hypothetical protein